MQITIIFLGNIGPQEQTTVLGDTYQRLAYRYIVAFLYQTILDVTTQRSRYRHTVLGLVLRNSLVCQLRIFITFLDGVEILLRYNLAFYQLGSTFIFFLCSLVCNAGTFYGVSVRHVLCRDIQDRSTFAYTHTVRYRMAKRHHTGYIGNDYALIALCSLHLSAGGYHLTECFRLDNFRLYPGRFRFFGSQDDFVRVTGYSSFRFMVMTFVTFILMVVVFFFVVMSFVIMVMSFVVVIMCFFRSMIVSFVVMARFTVARA